MRLLAMIACAYIVFLSVEKTMTSKTWYITGTSSGLGRILTEKLLRRGDRVFATVRSEGVLEALQVEFGERLIVDHLDVAEEGAPLRSMDKAFKLFGRIDVVVSNAGYGLYGAAEEVNDAQIRHQVDTNLIGSIGVIRAAVPHLRAQGGGRIVQISSAGGQITVPNYSVYHATKWGIEGFVEAMAQEVASFGIKCTIVEPGAAATNFLAGLVATPAMDIYENTPSGEWRRLIASGAFDNVGNPDRMCSTIIEFIDSGNPTLRLALGAQASDLIEQTLQTRLAEMRAVREFSVSAD
jgi:NAD(P)-dependent dehydrogenase (short-subunit alcohol dehydrogenase family)